MNEVHIFIYSMFGLSLTVWIVYHIYASRQQSLETEIADALRTIASHMQSGISLENAIVKYVNAEKNTISHHFRKVIKLAQQGMTIDQALHEASHGKGEAIMYVSELLTLTHTAKGDIIKSMKRIANRVGEVQFIQRRIDSKASKAITTIQFLCIIGMPALFYFLAQFLSTPEYTIIVDLPMQIYLLIIAGIASLIPAIMVSDYKESMVTFPLALSIVGIYIIELGALIASFAGV
ncbi:MAG: type II secretion system F family protein [Candidatus Woesearchaeota archaeon]